jgi:hypothetical protein
MACIFDFNGYVAPGHFLVAVWADWNGQEVIFGSDWAGVPDWPTPQEPSEEKVWAWATKHRPF